MLVLAIVAVELALELAAAARVAAVGKSKFAAGCLRR